MSSGLGRRLFASTGAATFSQIWRFGVTFATHMVLRRLVPEGEWGIYHWVADALFQLLAQVRDLGLPAQMVRARERPWRLYLGLQVGWGLGLGALVALLAPLIPAVYPEGGQAAIDACRFLVLFLVLDGIAKVPVTFFEAELALGRTVVPELARNIVYAGTAIALALDGRGLWALLVAHVASTAVYALLLWWQAWGHLPLATAPRGSVLQLVGGSSPLMLMAFVLIAIEWVDIPILGLFVDLETQGQYGGALRLAMLAAMMVELPVRRALYPAFVAVREDPSRLFGAYRLSTLALLAVQAPFAAILVLEPRTILTLAFGPTYADAAPYLQCLALVPLVQPFHRCVEDVLLARHQESYLILAAVLTLTSIAGLAFLFAAEAGALGVAWAKLLPLGTVVTAWAVARVDPAGMRRLAGEVGLLYATTALLFAPLWLVPEGFLRLVLAGLVAVLVVLAAGWRWGAQLRQVFSA